jgi:P-type Ca2+ transporter type 2C
VNDAMLTGLTAEEIERSRAQYGSNRLVEIKGRSLIAFVLEALNDRTLKILMACAGLVLVVDFFGNGRSIEGIAILVAVATATCVTAYNGWRAQAEFKSLQIAREALTVRARRGGSVEAISAFDVVVGDLIELEAGDKVPADGRILMSVELEMDESLLTGESEHVAKHPTSAAEIRAGTLVSQGRGLMQVTAVGDKTEYGRLRADLAVSEDLTPLQERLGRFADRIGLIGLAAAILVFVAQAGLALLTGRLGIDLGTARELLSYAVLAVTIVVVAVPEGLPVAVTISLAYSVMRMARDKSLVRRLMACETMGAADVICVDKTGTLTENRMRVEEMLLLDVDPVVDLRVASDAIPAATRAAFVEIAAVNSTAHLGDDPTGARGVIGNTTEGALLRLVTDWGADYRELRLQARVVAARGFTSDRKSMSTTVRRGTLDRLLLKGAPEDLLARCTFVLGRSGPRPLRDAERRDLRATIDRWTERALRPLLLAFRELPPAGERAQDEIDGELTLVGLVGIGDPLRAEVPEAIRTCLAAGVELKVVTGDNLRTAVAIARQAGIFNDGDLAMEGTELRALADLELRAVLPRLKLLARAVPSDKLRVVSLLKELGRVVAVTGDGTNDGPALRHADVGLSMGLSGTDVAREASDIVILDDNFASVVKTIRWGRTIFENIRKFLQFQLTVNAVALVTAFVAAVSGYGTPLTVVQLLWVNLIMDTLAALALSLEPATYELSHTTPHGRTTPLLSRWMWVHILGLGGLMVVMILVALYTDIWVPRSDPAHFTFVFNVFVLLQVGNLLNCRSTEPSRGAFAGLGQSKLFLAILGLILAVQWLIVQFGGSFFHTTPLGLKQWLLSAAMAAVMIVAGFMLRACGRSAVGGVLRRAGEAIGRRVRALAGRVWPWLDRPVVEGPLGLYALVGLVVVVAGIVVRSLGPNRAPIAFALFSAGVALCGSWAWERRHLLRRSGPSAVRLHIAISVLLGFILLVQVNYVASRHFHRFDLTSTQKFTLSPQTTSVLQKLDVPIRFTTIFREGSSLSEVRDLLAEYVEAGRYVEIAPIDPDRDPGAVERLADRAGLKNVQLSSVIIEYRDRFRVIPYGELWVHQYEYRAGKRLEVRGAPAIFRGEQALTSGLVAITNDAPIRVCFAVGHGEKVPDDFGSEGMAMARDRLRREGYLVEGLSLVNGASVPSRCNVLIQAGPRHPATPQDVAALDAYLQSGGKWLAMVEPWQAGGLDDLLRSWGVGVRPVYLADPSSTVAGISANSLVATHFQDHPVTAALGGLPLIFPYATSVYRMDAKRPLEGANIVLTSSQGIANTDRFGGQDSPPLPKEKGTQYAVAVAVSEPSNYYAADGRKEPARIVVVGDSDFASNRHLFRVGNADFLLNAVDWLARREALIGLRTQSAETRKVSLSVGGQTALYWTSLGLLPGLVGVLGAAVAWRRRK